MILFSLFSVWVLFLLLCFKIITVRSARLWPGRLKWAPVALFNLPLRTYPQWSAVLDLSILFVSPMNVSLHLTNNYIYNIERSTVYFLA